MSERDQLAFAARIRQPESQALLPGITAERMAVYEGLFFNNIESFLSSGFPVLRRLFDDELFVRTPDGISIELLQKGGAKPPAEPWASMANTGVW